jgi:hypothetical protein
MVENIPQPTSLIALANLWLRTMPLTLRFSNAITWFSLRQGRRLPPTRTLKWRTEFATQSSFKRRMSVFRFAQTGTSRSQVKLQLYDAWDVNLKTDSTLIILGRRKTPGNT